MHLQQQRTASLTFAISCRLLLIAVALTGNAKAQHFDSLGLSYQLRSGPSEDAILVANNGIRVPFGKSVFIDPINDLVIQVQPEDRCSIIVLENDPLTQRPGQLTPKKFPCDFGHNDVKYSHFGSRSPSKDRVKLQLRYDTQTDTIIIPFMMEVEVVFTQLEILTRNMPLTVEKLLGTSNPIDRKVLEFTFDRNSEVCKITTLTSASGLPRYGKLINNARVGKMVDCDEFVKLDARYQHTSVIRSPNRDYIPMVVELQDKEGNLLKQEYFQMMVRIREGEENTAPKPSFVAMMMMEVDQFVMTAITPDMLAAEDTESDPDDLIFNITSPLSSEQGYIVSTDDRNLPITSFYQGDLKDLKIAYKPPSEDSQVERIFQIEFEIVDTEGAVSDPFAFMIVVKPMNTLAPVVTRNTGQLLYEGQSRPLASSQNLQISDEDNLDEVRVTVIDGLRHGQLTILGSRRKFFTPADLDTGVVIYQHDGSDTYSDNIIFRMTDGKHEVEFLFPITIVPTDDEPPFINANTGLVLSKNEMLPISPFVLSATDIDSEDSTIRFTIEPPFSTIGEVVLRQSEAPEDRLSWTFIADDEVFEKVVTEWFQQDIMSGKLFYRHVGPHSTSTVMDQFVFRVQDDNDPPNQSDDEVPTIMLPAGTIGSYIDVLENGATEITTSVIQGRDEDTDDLMLTFIVEDRPLLGEILVNGIPTERFTQGDIINGVVVYAHTSGEIGLDKQEDYFNLTLSDLSDEWNVGGNKVQGVRVQVTILPVDSQAPEVTVGQQFTVVEGEKNAIELEHVSAEDIDTANDDILCTIIVQPTSGYIENISPAPGSEKSRSGTAVSAFTMKDIRLGHIYYVQSIHKGVEPVEDRFTFRCSDGINFSQRHFFPIIIVPANDEKPEIFMREFVVMEGMNIVIDTPILNAVDSDIPADDLMFIITKPPKHGFIVNQLTTGTVPVNNFTLDQIKESSSIVYEHDDSETTEDSFDIILTDGKHTVKKTVIIMVIPVDDETPRMTINDGLEIEIGESKIISNNVLKATDLDSEDKTLTYIIRYGPGQGLLQKQKPSGSFENITVGMNFTQDQVDKNLIVYFHNGQEGVRDLIKFDVTDGINPLIDRYFYITVGSIDMIFPDVISKGVSLKEGGRVTLTTDLLSTSDLNSPDENLEFTITRAPVRGHLECTDTPGVPISSFTQLQLAGNKVYYIHTSDDEVKMDSFEFEVTDGYNPVFRTFRVSITDVDNKKPVVTVHDLVVTEGENKLITPFELTVEDRDTPDHFLRLTITQVPVHGRLLFNSTRPVTSFTKQDLNENLISYKHDGTESPEDSFSFTVTDGTHTDFYVFPDTIFETRKPQMMKISIISVDNGVPQIIVNKGAPTLRILTTGHLGFMITSKALKAEDKDSTQISLKFKITLGPEHGYLINMGKGNDSITEFSQGVVRRQSDTLEWLIQGKEDFMRELAWMEEQARTSEERRRNAKLPSFNDTTSWDAFHAQVTVLGKLCSWSKGDMAQQVTAMLRGDAQMVLLNLAEEEMGSYHTLVATTTGCPIPKTGMDGQRKPGMTGHQPGERSKAPMLPSMSKRSKPGSSLSKSGSICASPSPDHYRPPFNLSKNDQPS
ncbi:FRAS1-related extracellular matrix protein 2 [Acipenser ruthenus]|uniref:FRAS1-related extracellular matrix protein 2 n=1 Tax=Acipenser ruthenus TaxID=7906 RepID=A0A444V494_ACIRT|nr:FRAS1-related extracellular matrix protein 2 [Acipenser ruthenus]